MIAPSPFPFQTPTPPGLVLRQPLGEGGSGKVYLAERVPDGGRVAVKFLGPAQGTTIPKAELQREVRLMAGLDHPNVVRIQGSGTFKGRPYLLLEYVEGQSLRARMRPGTPWRVRDALPVLAAVADALDYVHGRGILHLDLKPENVLCGTDGSVKITDFGLARFGTEAPGAGPARGSIDYCAPEQRHGLPVDARADLFAFGVLAYELLTGRLPGRVFVPPSEMVRRLPRAADPLFARALARNPEDRPAAVAAWFVGLRAALNRPSPWRRWWPW